MSQQTSGVKYGADMPLHATLHAAPFIYTAAAQRQEHNYWSLQRQQQQRQEEQNIVEQHLFHKKEVASIQKPDPPASPFIPTPHGGTMPPVNSSMGSAGGWGAEGGREGSLIITGVVPGYK